MPMGVAMVRNALFLLVKESQPRGSLFCYCLGRRARKEAAMREKGRKMRKWKWNNK